MEAQSPVNEDESRPRTPSGRRRAPQDETEDVETKKAHEKEQLERKETMKVISGIKIRLDVQPHRTDASKKVYSVNKQKSPAFIRRKVVPREKYKKEGGKPEHELEITTRSRKSMTEDGEPKKESRRKIKVTCLPVEDLHGEKAFSEDEPTSKRKTRKKRQKYRQRAGMKLGALDDKEQPKRKRSASRSDGEAEDDIFEPEKVNEPNIEPEEQISPDGEVPREDESDDLISLAALVRNSSKTQPPRPTRRRDRRRRKKFTLNLKFDGSEDESDNCTVKSSLDEWMRRFWDSGCDEEEARKRGGDGIEKYITVAKCFELKEEDQSKAICKVCQNTLSAKPFNLKRHTDRHHSQMYRYSAEELDEAIQVERLSLEKPDSTKKTRKKVKKLASASSITEPPTKEMLDTAFVDWLTTERLPYSVVQNPNFREVLSELNPSYIVPESVDTGLLEKHAKKPLVPESAEGITTDQEDAEESKQTLKSDKMGAIVIEKAGGTPVYKDDVERPVAQPGEALIRVLRAGICATDMEIMNGYKQNFQGILGHEFVGRVVAVGNEEDSPVWMDKRVVGEINLPCGCCKICSNAAYPRDLRRNHCPSRKCLGIVEKNGAFAEYVTLPIENLFVLPENVSDPDAVFVEPIAAAYRIVEQKIISPRDRVAIIGDGRLGLMLSEVLCRENLQHQVILIGKNPTKLRLAPPNVRTMLLYEHTMIKNSVDICIDCSGNPLGLDTACKVTRVNGTIILKTTCSEANSTTGIDMNRLIEKKLTIVGSRCGPFLPAIELLASGALDLKKYITSEFPLHEAQAAFDATSTKGCMKIQLVMPYLG